MHDPRLALVITSRTRADDVSARSNAALHDAKAHARPHTHTMHRSGLCRARARAPACITACTRHAVDRKKEGLRKYVFRIYSIHYAAPTSITPPRHRAISNRSRAIARLAAYPLSRRRPGPRAAITPPRGATRSRIDLVFESSKFRVRVT